MPPRAPCTPLRLQRDGASVHSRSLSLPALAALAARSGFGYAAARLEDSSPAAQFEGGDGTPATDGGENT